MGRPPRFQMRVQLGQVVGVAAISFVGGFLVSTKQVKMLQYGYNGSGIAPYQYEEEAVSTTIALHCEVTLHHHCVGDLGGDLYKRRSFTAVLSPYRDRVHTPKHRQYGDSSIWRVREPM
jgi:hypothetical protein